MKLNKVKKDKGAVSIVEATFVLPITFFIVFILLFFGNAMFLKANVDALTNRYTILAAAEAGDPILKKIDDSGKMPTKSSEVDTKPYRYVTKGYGNSVGATYSERLKKEIKKTTGFFWGMTPKIEKCQIKYNNYFLYQTMETTVDYKIKLPIKMIFTNDSYILRFVSFDEQPVNDTSELILNINMVLDYYEGSALEEKVDQVKDKISEAFGKLKGALDQFLG